MPGKTLRVVDHADDSIQWAVRAVSGGPMLFVAKTRQEAIEVAARQLMASPLGGLLKVYSPHGGVEHVIPYTVAGPTLEIPSIVLDSSESDTVKRGLQVHPKAPDEPSTISPVISSNLATPQSSPGAEGNVSGSHPSAASAGLAQNVTPTGTSELLSDGRPARRWPTGWIWPTVFIFVPLLALGANAQEAFQSLLYDSKEDRISTTSVVAAYTFPATASFYLAALAIFRKWLSGVPGHMAISGAGLLFLAMGWIAETLALGLGVDFTSGQATGGNIALILLNIFTAYITSWGLPLFTAAGLIGVAAAMETDNLMRKRLGV